MRVRISPRSLIDHRMQTYHLIFPISFSYLVQTISRTSLQAPEQKEAPPYFTSTAPLSQRNNVSCSLLFEDCPKKEEYKQQALFIFTTVSDMVSELVDSVAHRLLFSACVTRCFLFMSHLVRDYST